MRELTINEQESINGGGWWNWQTFFDDLGDAASIVSYGMQIASCF